MGLAASQARYLSLTARKTNVEYEGQQVNQERTALANQSAALFNEMLALEVPTPPSATDYSKIVYTYVDTSTSENITLESIYKNPSDAGATQATYTVSGYRKESTVIANLSNIVKNGTGVNGYTMDYDDKKAIYTITANGGTRMTVSGPAKYSALTAAFNEAKKNADQDQDATADDEYFVFTNPATGVQYFIPSGEMTSVKDLYENYKTAGSLDNIEIFAAQSTVANEFFHIDDAILTTASDGTGRFDSISYYAADQYNADGTLKENARRTICKLTQQTIQDDDAFDAAMETYEAKKAIYDKTIADIDAKTTIIQQQDKTLELHLDQLDTEQQAIQTELDAVKKVIDKNIEETFKTFA